MFSIVVTSDVIGAVLIVVSLLKARHKKRKWIDLSWKLDYLKLYILLNLKIEIKKKNKPLKIANIRFCV